MTPMLHAVTFCTAFLNLCIDFRPPFLSIFATTFGLSFISLCVHFRSTSSQSMPPLPVFLCAVYASASGLSFLNLCMCFHSLFPQFIHSLLVFLSLICALIPRPLPPSFHASTSGLTFLVHASTSGLTFLIHAPTSDLTFFSPGTNFRVSLHQSMHPLPV